MEFHLLIFWATHLCMSQDTEKSKWSMMLKIKCTYLKCSLLSLPRLSSSTAYNNEYDIRRMNRKSFRRISFSRMDVLNKSFWYNVLSNLSSMRASFEWTSGILCIFNVEMLVLINYLLRLFKAFYLLEEVKEMWLKKDARRNRKIVCLWSSSRF